MSSKENTAMIPQSPLVQLALFGKLYDGTFYAESGVSLICVVDAAIKVAREYNIPIKIIHEELTAVVSGDMDWRRVVNPSDVQHFEAREWAQSAFSSSLTDA